MRVGECCAQRGLKRGKRCWLLLAGSWERRQKHRSEGVRERKSALSFLPHSLSQSPQQSVPSGDDGGSGLLSLNVQRELELRRRLGPGIASHRDRTVIKERSYLSTTLADSLCLPPCDNETPFSLSITVSSSVAFAAPYTVDLLPAFSHPPPPLQPSPPLPQQMKKKRRRRRGRKDLSYGW